MVRNCLPQAWHVCMPHAGAVPPTSLCLWASAVMAAKMSCCLSPCALLRCGLSVHAAGNKVAADVHVFGHSHRCIDIWLPYTVGEGAGGSGGSRNPSGARSGSNGSNSRVVGNESDTVQQQQQQQQPAGSRYIQYALDAVGPATAGLCCIWDGELMPPGCILSVDGSAAVAAALV